MVWWLGEEWWKGNDRADVAADSSRQSHSAHVADARRSAGCLNILRSFCCRSASVIVAVSRVVVHHGGGGRSALANTVWCMGLNAEVKRSVRIIGSAASSRVLLHNLGVGGGC